MKKVKKIGKGTWKVMQWLSKGYDFVKWLFIIFGALWGYGLVATTIGLFESFSVWSLVWDIICLAFFVATIYFGFILWRVTAAIRGGKALFDRADNVISFTRETVLTDENIERSQVYVQKIRRKKGEDETNL